MTKQIDLIDFLHELEEDRQGKDLFLKDLTEPWNIELAIISRYRSGTKEIPTWRLVWFMKRFPERKSDILNLLEKVYTDKILKKCLKNRAFSASICQL